MSSTRGAYNWRSAFLRFAKWPYVLLGFFEALTQTRWKYIITKKDVTASTEHPLTVPHFLTAAVVGAAWLTGTLLGRITNHLLHFGAAIVICSSIAVVASGYLGFPAPYDPELAQEQFPIGPIR